MSSDGAVERREEPPHPTPPRNGNGNGVAAPAAAARPMYGDRRLRLNPNKEHKPERYDDLQSEFDPVIFSSLERHLPPSMLEVPREAKAQFMKEILARYLPEGERTRVSPRSPLLGALFSFASSACSRVSEIRVSVAHGSFVFFLREMTKKPSPCGFCRILPVRIW